MKAFISYSHVYWLAQAGLIQITDLLISWGSSLHLQVAWDCSVPYLSFRGPHRRSRS